MYVRVHMFDMSINVIKICLSSGCVYKSVGMNLLFIQ